MAKAQKLGGGSVTLDDAAFGERFNMPLVHETVRAELNARRRGTAATKTRGMVSGGGAKPWRQKGTGRARAGSSRSPIWTGGGTVFGPSPRSYTFKVNRKARRAALRGALSLHADRESLAVFDASAFDGPSTKQAFGLLSDWGADKRTLVLLGPDEADAGLSFRNIAHVAVMTAEDAGVADIVGAAHLLVSEVALPALVARANGEKEDAEPEAAAASKPAKKASAKAEAAPAATAEPEEDASSSEAGRVAGATTDAPEPDEAPPAAEEDATSSDADPEPEEAE